MWSSARCLLVSHTDTIDVMVERTSPFYPMHQPIDLTVFLFLLQRSAAQHDLRARLVQSLLSISRLLLVFALSSCYSRVSLTYRRIVTIFVVNCSLFLTEEKWSARLHRHLVPESRILKLQAPHEPTSRLRHPCLTPFAKW